MARFRDTHVFRAERFSLGIDDETGRHYLSTPVSGHMMAAEYEAYFALSPDEYKRFARDPVAALLFTAACRVGGHACRRL